MVLRLIFSFLILIHGLIPLMGVAQEWNLSKTEQLSGKTLISITGSMAKVMGLLWLLTFLLFLLAMIGFLWRINWWWLPVGLAIVLSQLLIIIYWPDAKAGTIANVLILIPAVIAYAGWDFNQRVDKEVNTILSEVSAPERQAVTSEMLVDLPLCVRQWLEKSQVVGRESIKTVRLQQKGQMRTKPDGSWMLVEAEQYFTTEKPAFVWKANIQAASLLHIAGRDK